MQSYVSEATSASVFRQRHAPDLVDPLEQLLSLHCDWSSVLLARCLLFPLSKTRGKIKDGQIFEHDYCKI